MKIKSIFIIIGCLICLSISGQNKNVHFSFPVKPGDDAWTKMGSPISRIISMQVPDSILFDISTEELLNVCLDFPYIIDLAFSDNYQKGLEILMGEFNGFKELLNREDVVAVLEKELEAIPQKVCSLKNKTDIEKGSFSFKCLCLELLIAQDTILSRLDQEKEKSISVSLLKNDGIKKTEPDIFGEINDVSTSLILAKMALRSTNYEISKIQREELIRFASAPIRLNPTILEFLTEYKRKLLK